ncbi:hypothetical protein JX265_010859 [Neoarthrinium moseri]|uniref:FAD-binding PCMH-type domain-containing protein n=1 Tax=Neoarthrinium moseri TaxID=1658444 RepID=A0A9P9WDM5_9PEZI|nr:hypothetical protein JX265_010859 [Neoarthrinium moseri]
MKLHSVLTLGALVVTPCRASCSSSPLIDCLNSKEVPFKLPCDSDWNDYAPTFNVRLPVTPAVIVLPKLTTELGDAVVCADHNHIHVQARSGGHSYASYSHGGVDGAMMVVLKNFNSVHMAPGNSGQNATAYVGGGVRLGNMAKAIYDADKRAMAHGTCSGVGIGGHATHGGYGFSSRSWGLALDQITGLDVILADGNLVTATADQYPDVYWAMRGAADSIGIATGFYMQTSPAPEKVVNFVYDLSPFSAVNVSTAVDSFLKIQDFVHNSTSIDRKLGFGMTLGKTSGDKGTGIFRLQGAYLGSEAEYTSRVEPLFLGGLQWATKNVAEYDWPSSLAALDGVSLTPPDPYNLHSNFFAKSVVVPEPGMNEKALTTYFEYILNGPKAPTDYFILVDLWGGADSQINTKDTEFAAFPYRNTLWVAQHYAQVAGDSPFPKEGIDWLNGLNDAMTQNLPVWHMYQNYIDPTLSREEAQAQYYTPEVLRRLRQLKEYFDPNNVFANPQSI